MVVLISVFSFVKSKLLTIKFYFMKKLELNQMEGLEGGGCKEDVINWHLATYSLVFAIATGGPFGIALAAGAWIYSSATACK